MQFKSYSVQAIPIKRADYLQTELRPVPENGHNFTLLGKRLRLEYSDARDEQDFNTPYQRRREMQPDGHSFSLGQPQGKFECKGFLVFINLTLCSQVRCIVLLKRRTKRLSSIVSDFFVNLSIRSIRLANATTPLNSNR